MICAGGVALPDEAQIEDERYANPTPGVGGHRCVGVALHANPLEVLFRTESDCVSTTEQILRAGGIDSSARSPVGLWGRPIHL